MSPIFLIGFMGSGKTTLGRALGAATGMRFVDLDELIEERCGASVSEIFAREGEARFRQIEHDVLAEVCALSDLIVACGGGTPCFGTNMDLMNNRGLTVWLEAKPEVLLRRLALEPGKRPLVDGLSPRQLAVRVGEMLREREPHYSHTRARFDSSRLETPREVSESVERFIAQFINPAK